MAIQITSTYLGGVGTGVANQYRVLVRHEALFPNGDTDPVTGDPVLVPHGVERTIVVMAASLTAFVVAVKTDGNAWKAEIVTAVAAEKRGFSAGIKPGDAITY